jgi:hypothetical protein
MFRRESKASIGAFDAPAFHCIENLVCGPLKNLNDLVAAEAFIRLAVLHDEIHLHNLPGPRFRTPQCADILQTIDPNYRDVSLYDYYGTALGRTRPPLSPSLMNYAVEWSDGIRANIFRHLDDMDAPLDDADIPFWTGLDPRTPYALEDADKMPAFCAGMVQELMWTIRDGGSALLETTFGAGLLKVAENRPEALFSSLDQSWSSYAQQIERDGLGFLVPPMLAIVLTRCARREAIPVVIRDLRLEWAEARRKVWALLEALRICRTLKEAIEIRSELASASELMSQQETELDTRPVRILWEIVASSAAGAAIAGLSGARPAIGAAAGAATQAARNIPSFTHEFGRMLFGRGAFDLARRIRRELSKVELEALPGLLSGPEKEALASR